MSVQVDTVDAYCRNHGIDSIDVLKVDTQGYDLKVLMGAAEMLRARTIRSFFVEAMFMPMYHAQPTLTDFLAFATSVGYRAVGFYDPFYMRNQLSHINICFEPVS
jgi:hypothetical protein